MHLKGKILAVLVSVLLSITLAYYLVFRLVILQSCGPRADGRGEEHAALRRDPDRAQGLLNQFVYDWLPGTTPTASSGTATRNS